MTLLQGAILFGAALLAGALNSVAGGGSFISFPTLMYVGIRPTLANATNTVALWPGSVASVGAYRSEFTAQGRILAVLGAASLVGGYLGARLLLSTPERTFLHVLPFLMLGATLLFAAGGKLTSRIRLHPHGEQGFSWRNAAGVALLQLVISVYGGYFGGGIGILMLATLALMGMEDIHTMNALKTLLASLINGVAVIIFIASKAVYWHHAVIMIVGAILGGYFGAYFARKIKQVYVRSFVIAVGLTITVIFFRKW